MSSSRLPTAWEWMVLGQLIASCGHAAPVHETTARAETAALPSPTESGGSTRVGWGGWEVRYVGGVSDPVIALALAEDGAPILLARWTDEAFSILHDPFAPIPSAVAVAPFELGSVAMARDPMGRVHVAVRGEGLLYVALGPERVETVVVPPRVGPRVEMGRELGLAVASDGRAYLCWIEGESLHYAVLDGGRATQSELGAANSCAIAVGPSGPVIVSEIAGSVSLHRFGAAGATAERIGSGFEPRVAIGPAGAVVAVLRDDDIVVITEGVERSTGSDLAAYERATFALALDTQGTAHTAYATRAGVHYVRFGADIAHEVVPAHVSDSRAGSFAMQIGPDDEPRFAFLTSDGPASRVLAVGRRLPDASCAPGRVATGSLCCARGQTLDAAGACAGAPTCALSEEDTGDACRPLPLLDLALGRLGVAEVADPTTLDGHDDLPSFLAVLERLEEGPPCENATSCYARGVMALGRLTTTAYTSVEFGACESGAGVCSALESETVTLPLGDGDEVDIDTAVASLEAACAAGHPSACFVRGLEARVLGGSSLRWYESACTLGIIAACGRFVGEAAPGAERERVTAILRAACSAGDPAACSHLAFVIESSVDAVAAATVVAGACGVTSDVLVPTGEVDDADTAEDESVALAADIGRRAIACVHLTNLADRIDRRFVPMRSALRTVLESACADPEAPFQAAACFALERSAARGLGGRRDRGAMRQAFEAACALCDPEDACAARCASPDR